jgi:hypothetical protein
MSTATNALAMAIGAGAGLGAWYVLRGKTEGAPGATAAPTPSAAPGIPAPPPPAIPPCRLRVDAKTLTVNGLPATVGVAVAACKLTGGADLTVTRDAPGAVLLELTAALGREGIRVVSQHRNGRKWKREADNAIINLRHFADTVREVAQAVDENPTADGRARGRFGRKVFIAAIRRALKQTPYWRMSPGRIDELLIDANRDGLLQLTRADLVGAMDPAEVRTSEIESLGSTFHFVVADRAERNATTYSRFTLRMYPEGSTGNATARWFITEPAVPWAEARDRLIAAGIVTAETGGRTYAPGGWMLSVDASQFNPALAEPLP